MFTTLAGFLLEKYKHSEQEAGYVAHTVKGQRCDECTMWRAPNKCSAVAGDIKPEAWCKWWKKSKRKNLTEALAGVTPEQEKEVIDKSFKQNVISDLLAGASVKSSQDLDWGDCKTCPFSNVCDKATQGDVIDSNLILNDLQKQIPSINFKKFITVDSSVNRVMIKFTEGGEGGNIHIPEKLNKVLGPIIVLHEIAHKLYSIDILTPQIVNHPLAAEIFTLARTIEDARVEKLMEQEYPQTFSIFKERAKYIIPLYKSHAPSGFAKIVDDLFLNLRGYSGGFNHNKNYLKLGQQFINAGNNRDAKVNTVIKLAELINKNENI